MRQRGHMMLDWIFADQFANSLNGVLHGAERPDRRHSP